ncbi:MAG: threonine ammonia-lyase [Pseudomonadota bacterium]
MTLSAAAVQAAYDAIQGSIIRTPTVRAARLSLKLGLDLHLKLENLQHTNAFKARGALAKLLTLSPEELAVGVIACSAGNHAQGVAFHSERLGVRSVVVMPESTPFNKVKRTADFGAEVILHGASFDESVAFTLEKATAEGLTLIHPFDDPDVVAGQGTVAIEMLEQEPDLDAIVVPIGGGGLIAGIALAAKAIRPEIEIIGAQSQHFDAVKAHLYGSEPTIVGATMAEGIAVRQPSPRNLEVIRSHVDQVVTATEEEIEDALFDLLSNEKLVAEGAAGAGLAVVKALQSSLSGRKVGLVLCGGNLDSRLLSTLILRGLVKEGRITRLTFEIDDTPGQLSEISRLIGESRANVLEVIHQRMFQSVSLKQAELDVVIEGRDWMHADEIVEKLRTAGFRVSKRQGL